MNVPLLRQPGDSQTRAHTRTSEMLLDHTGPWEHHGYVPGLEMLEGGN